MKKLNLLLTMLTPIAALANVPVVETGEAVDATLKQFLQEEGSHAAHFTGVKGWPSGSGYTVKVYLMDGSALNYGCMKHEMNGQLMMMCSKQ